MQTAEDSSMPPQGRPAHANPSAPVATSAPPGMPDPAPLAMPERACRWQASVRAAVPDGTTTRQPRALRRIALGVTLLIVLALLAAMLQAMAPLMAERPLIVATVLSLFTVNSVWIAWAAVTAALGAMGPARARATQRAPGSNGRIAVLVTLCGEPAAPVAANAAALRRDLDRSDFGTRVDIVLLSDTTGAEAIAAEDRAVAPLARLDGIHFRRRAARDGRKPGNIADWLRRWGGRYAFMAILDADSRMTAARLQAMAARLEAEPTLGLVQSGMRLLPARSRFGALQRLSSRLCGPAFIAGMAAWAGREGNFWGHNAMLRVAAFADAAGLPRLSGRAPFGGDLLSHDFVEAAWLRRSGWGVEILPDSRGSFEDGPQSLGDFHRRDRRWCQGNLQHLRLVWGARMHPLSRLHLISGIHSYLSAPVWLALVMLLAFAAPGAAALPALAGTLALLLVPKLAGILHWLRRSRHLRHRPGVLLRATGAELALSTLLAPLVLVRQTAAVASVLAGRDAGWRPGAKAARLALGGLPEAMAGLALMAVALGLGAGAGQMLWLFPLIGPLMGAPLLVRWLDAPVRRSVRRRVLADDSAPLALAPGLAHRAA